VRLAAFARELQRYQHSVQVVTAMPNYPAGVVQPAYRGKILAHEQIDGIPVTRTWVYAATGRNIIKRLANYFSFTLSSLIALMIVPRAEVLFVESPPLFLGLSAWVAATLRRQKLCINISDLWPDSVVALGLMREGTFVKAARWLERWLYRRAWRVCAVTKGIVETIIEKKGVVRGKVCFLPNGVDVALFVPQSPDKDRICQLGLEGKYIFAYTGTHGYAQGLDVIIDTAYKLRHRSDVAFLFVGEGPEKQRLQNMVQKMRLQNVVFIDVQPAETMPQILALTTACLVPLRDLPLFRDARPSKIFPPLGCARPVIYSGAGEAADLIERAECGIVTPPESGQALAEAIIYMIEHPDEVVEMGQRGRTLVEREYSWSAIVARWLAELNV
jgi:glycosyltransferase involved in cell wall biosynthesis